MHPVLGGLDHAGYLFRAEYNGQLLGSLREDQVIEPDVPPLQCFSVEKAQCRHPHLDSAGR
jgi:hypothetical protein